MLRTKGKVVRTLTVPDGATIAYRLWQPGRPRPVLVLLHGVASNMTRWSEFVARTTLKDSWDLLRLDLRGQGASLHRGRIGMAEWCADLASVLDAEGYPQAVVAVGSSTPSGKSKISRGLRFVHLFSPCPPGWRFDPSESIEIARLAVKSGMWILWEQENGVSA